MSFVVHFVCTQEVSPKCAWFNNDDIYVVFGKLSCKSFREACYIALVTAQMSESRDVFTFKGEFGSCIQSRGYRPIEAGNTGDVDDCSGLPLTKLRQRCSNQPIRTIKIDIHLSVDLLVTWSLSVLVKYVALAVLT